MAIEVGVPNKDHNLSGNVRHGNPNNFRTSERSQRAD